MTRSASSGHKWIDTLQYHNSLDLVEMLHTHTHVQNEMEKQSNSVIDHWLVLLHCTRRNILLVVTGLEIQATEVEASEVLEALEESSVEVLVDVKVEHTAKGLMEDLVEDKSDPFRKVEMYATPLYASASEKHAVTKSNTTLSNHLCSNT
jgi:hypothetical protein